MKKNILHGTAVALGNGAVFLKGPSGSGKSDLAFRLLATGGRLIADDQVEFKERLDRLYLSPVETISGLLEVRGVGLVKVPAGDAAVLRLVVELVPRENVPRLPGFETVDMYGFPVPRLYLHAFDASTPLKILKAMELVDRPDLLVK